MHIAFGILYHFCFYRRIKGEEVSDGASGAPVTSLAVSFTYDALSRETVGFGGATYAYDNLNRPLTGVLSGVTTPLVWGALSSQTSEAGPLGAVAYQ